MFAADSGKLYQVQHDEMSGMETQLIKPDICFRLTFGLDRWCSFVLVEPPPRDAFTLSAGCARTLGDRFLSGKYVDLKRNPSLVQELCHVGR